MSARQASLASSNACRVATTLPSARPGRLPSRHVGLPADRIAVRVFSTRRRPVRPLSAARAADLAAVPLVAVVVVVVVAAAGYLPVADRSLNARYQVQTP